MTEQNYTLAIHGGAGVILPERTSTEKEAAYRAKLGQSMEAGEHVLKAGGLVAVDAHGNIALELNTPGMYRGSVRCGEAIKIEIFK